MPEEIISVHQEPATVRFLESGGGGGDCEQRSYDTDEASHDVAEQSHDQENSDNLVDPDGAISGELIEDIVVSSEEEEGERERLKEVEHTQ